MDVDVGIEIENNLDQEMTIRIPAGSIFETATAEMGVQNVVVIADYKFRLLPKTKHKVILCARCLNRRRSVPKMTPGRATPFLYVGGSFEQDAIWNTVCNPKTE